MSSTSTPSNPRTRPKATLFCPECGHESHVEGDWVVSTTAGRVRTDCPDCGTCLDDRPRTVERPPVETETNAESTTAVTDSHESESSGDSPRRRESLLDAAVASVDASCTVQRHVLGWWATQSKRLTSLRTSV